MAFQMIPPRVSSSPPPLDTLPSVACTGDDDDDDDFGNFATHSTFDITGLSDKLPPTPEHDLAKSTEETKDFDNTLKTEGFLHTSVVSKTCSENLSSLRDKDVNGEVCGSLRDDDDEEDFGDFSCFTARTATGETEFVNASEEVKTGDIDSSQNYSLEPKVVDSSPNHSDRSFSMIATPPPLDHVVENILVDDEFSRISPNPPHADDDEDDFGDFTACTFENSKDSQFRVVGTSKECATSCQNISSQVPDEGDHKPNTVCGGAPECSENPVVSSKTSAGKDSDLGTESENDPHKAIKAKCVDSYSEITDRTKNHEDCNADSSYSECQVSKDEGPSLCSESEHRNFRKDDSDPNLTSSGPPTDRKNSSEISLPGVVDGDFNQGLFSISNKESCLAQNLTITDSNVENDSGEWGAENKLEDQIDKVSACPIRESDDDVRTKVIEGNDTKKDTDCGKGSISFNRDTNGDEFECDWDLKDFEKAGGDEDDEDDLDFGDLREQVRSGKFGMNDSVEEDDDFGDFYDGTHVAPQVLKEDADQEFETFGSAVTGDEEADEFGDFAQVEPDDDFGNFESPEGQILEKGGTSESVLTDEDNEFGDFTSQQNVENQSDFIVPWHEHATSTSSKDSTVLRKLESLILKWIPKEPVTSTTEYQDNQIVPTLFQSVEDDAFVWRQLENLEASTALTLSWGNTQAQTLYLSSVNVDARNIVSKSAMITLFGQKWSSSVPLFAQTLSFSPLTPAKPTENGSSLDGGNRGSVSPPVLPSGITPKFSASLRKDENEVEITPDNENTPEEQIPPAKFDWTSSGLTNPLEGPGLEREFLSEGEEKGISRIKGPPAPSPLVQQILGSGMNTTHVSTTPLQSLSTEIREVVEHLPNIGFMRSRVLMFPIRGDD